MASEIPHPGLFGAELHHGFVDHLLEDAALVFRFFKRHGIERLAFLLAFGLPGLIETAAEII